MDGMLTKKPVSHAILFIFPDFELIDLILVVQ